MTDDLKINRYHVAINERAQSFGLVRAPDGEVMLSKDVIATLQKVREWTEDDLPIPEDDAIRAAHPTVTGQHGKYAEAMRLVGAKRSKYALVDLVNWLLCEICRLRRDGHPPSPPTNEEADIEFIARWMFKQFDSGDPDELIYQGNPPEPYGSSWLRYYDSASALFDELRARSDSDTDRKPDQTIIKSGYYGDGPKIS